MRRNPDVRLRNTRLGRLGSTTLDLHLTSLTELASGSAAAPNRSGYFPRDVFFFGFGFAAPLPLSAACCFFFLAGISTSLEECSYPMW